MLHNSKVSCTRCVARQTRYSPSVDPGCRIKVAGLECKYAGRLYEKTPPLTAFSYTPREYNYL